jgi:hypothetical protein
LLRKLADGNVRLLNGRVEARVSQDGRGVGAGWWRHGSSPRVPTSPLAQAAQSRPKERSRSTVADHWRGCTLPLQMPHWTRRSSFRHFNSEALMAV